MNGATAWADLSAGLQIAIVVLGGLQVGLQVFALLRLLRTPEDRLQTGKRWIWLLIVLLGGLVGAIVFLAAGRLPPEAADPALSRRSERATAEQGRGAADVLYGKPGEDRPDQERDRPS